MASGQRLRASQHRVARLPVVGGDREIGAVAVGGREPPVRLGADAAAGRPGRRTPRRRACTGSSAVERGAEARRDPLLPVRVVDHDHVDAGRARPRDLVGRGSPTTTRTGCEPGRQRGVERPGDQRAAAPARAAASTRRRRGATRGRRGERSRDRRRRQPERSGPARSSVIRTMTRCSRTIAAR